MRLRTINLSSIAITSLIATPLTTISCQQKQIPLRDAVTVKDFGYITDLTRDEILQKLLSLNPNLEVGVADELMVVILHNEARFGIHPGSRKKSRYRGNLKVEFSSYITPLYVIKEGDSEIIIHLTTENRKFSAEFKITKDYGCGGKKIRCSSYDEYVIKKYEEKIEEIPGDSKYRKLIVDFELNEGITETERVYYSFYIEDAILPEIIFDIN